MDYIPLRSTSSPRIFRWARRLLIGGLIALLGVIGLTMVNVLPDDTAWFTLPILMIAASLYLYWEVG